MTGMSLPLKTEFLGDRSALFSFGLKLSVFTVLTLGIYRFWMKTRLRRWYWSAIRPGGHPLEYTGEALEKLLGFLIAVVFLSFYIGVFNLILMFFSFTLLNDNFAAYAISFIAVIPILFFAQYRARRYILARTRWRGIRFGLQPAAWRYSAFAILMWVLTIISLGALWPLMTFQLEKFRTNRTWFGTARLTQGGKWYRLIPPALPALLGLWATLALGVYGALEEDPAAIGGMLLTLPLTAIGWVHYKVAAFRYLTSQKQIGDMVALSSAPRTPRVLGIYLLGGLAISMILSAVAAVVGTVVVSVFLAAGAAESIEETSPWLAIPVGLLGYFSIFVFWDVLTQVFIRLPLLQHYSETLEIEDPHALTRFAQRARDESVDAGGFAEALDVGAAI